jgi:hypothetical protein
VHIAQSGLWLADPEIGAVSDDFNGGAQTPALKFSNAGLCRKIP